MEFRRSLFLSVAGLALSGLFALASPGAAACQASIPEDATISESWFSTCTSTHRTGAYAQYYTFTLTKTSFVQIGLSSSTDPYLYLLSGDQPGNPVITQDDNGGGNFNSRIGRTLTAGTYTIEVVASMV